MKQNGVERVTIDEVKTLGDLHEFGWVSRSVKDEMRSNLIRLIKINQQPFKGILGYEHTVMPQIQQAILAKHDFILLGLRGQGKTKLLRQLIYLLDDYMPIVEGSVIQDDPFRPLSRYAVDKINDMGMDTPI
ncbi:MAG: magnesium chelatase, partial [Bacteroidota bacterium]